MSDNKPDLKTMLEKWNKKIETINEAVQWGFLDLTGWECTFIDSIMIRLSEEKELTWKQSKCLNAIFNRIE